MAISVVPSEIVSSGVGSRVLPRKFCRTLLEFVNKKKRRRGSDDEGSDVELQYGPGERPPSPIDDVDRRRSGRSTKRKKYVDEVEFNFSDDENLLLPNDTVAAPVVKVRNVPAYVIIKQ